MTNHGKKGFTLIELVITMVLIGIVAYIAADAMSTGIKVFFVTENRKEALDQARIAMERMTREIRNLRSNSDVGTGSGTQFCFTNVNGTTISFRYSGSPANTIARQDGLANLAACPGAAGNTLSNNITTLTFSYIRLDGTVDAAFSAANTKRIRIIITSNESGETVTLQSDVWLRNL
jgi:prepilin-type N-terminal cleavage/methylation domain-containing protein